MARNARPLPHLGLGGHAPADDRRCRARTLRGLSGALPRPRGPRRCAGAWGPRGMVGPRLLRSRAQPPAGGARGDAAARGPSPARAGGAPDAAGFRGLHRRGGRLAGLRREGSRRGRQRDPRPLAPVRDRRNGRQPAPHAGGSRARRSPGRPRPTGRRDGGPHGPRPARVHTAPARVCGLPARPGLRGAAARRRRAFPTQESAAQGPPRPCRGGLRRARPGGSARPPKRRAPSRPLAVSLRGGSDACGRDEPPAARACKAGRRARSARRAACDAAHHRPPPPRDPGSSGAPVSKSEIRNPKFEICALVHARATRPRRDPDADATHRGGRRVPAARQSGYSWTA